MEYAPIYLSTPATQEMIYMFYGFTIPVSALGLAGNSLTCHVIINKESRSQQLCGYDLVLLAMAVCDVLYIPINWMTDTRIFVMDWPYGDIGCKVLMPLPLLLLGTSLWMKALVAMSRMTRIRSPLQVTTSSFCAKVIMVLRGRI